MKKLIVLAVVSGFALTAGIASAQDATSSNSLPVNATTSAVVSPVNSGQIVRNAEQQIKALRKELDAKIKALRAEYETKIRAIRATAKTQTEQIRQARKQAEKDRIERARAERKRMEALRKQQESATSTAR